ncbi:hypothetical protein H6F86_25965 [Phormidium sp. FACHB-592]|uniref:Uncharacterized protein n=1 Tax=Stenomitos frigidus AS-A4 TaxID=2933935 RepID=A0ABV0KSM7_9CYAN|nr:hypothetical protein [Phormidium sp. FACHB-592]MBD2077262.1 hypothetical protein [Phormidium sp. FACHB-592]
MTEASNRRRKDSAKLVWDTKLKRAPNPRDIEFQTAEIVIPNLKQDQEPELRKAIKDNFGAHSGRKSRVTSREADDHRLT